jgi:hypothetical protein
MKKTDYRRKLFFDFPELIYERHLSRRQFIKAAGISAFGVALSSPMFLSCTKEHVEQFVNWIAELPELINDYRKKNGQPEIKLSSKLSAVAMAHVRDLSTYHPEQICGPNGNLHSWSDNGNWQGKYGNGNWIGCCYPDDHSKKHCMWDKPKEITGYQGNGYEIAHHGSSTAQGALNSWKSSPGHNDVILSKGDWSNFQWKAIGALYGGGYACAWFGMTPD